MAVRQHALHGSICKSPLRIDLMDDISRKHLRDYMQARLVSYYEDEYGQPAYPPDERPALAAVAAAKSTAGRMRRPVRGLVTLRASSKDTTERGVSALMEISTECDLTLWGGANFDEELLKVDADKICSHFFEDPARQDVFVLSVMNNQSTGVPSVCCFVSDRSKWLGILRRRGVKVTGAVDV